MNFCKLVFSINIDIAFFSYFWDKMLYPLLKELQPWLVWLSGLGIVPQT